MTSQPEGDGAVRVDRAAMEDLLLVVERGDRVARVLNATARYGREGVAEAAEGDKVARVGLAVMVGPERTEAKAAR